MNARHIARFGFLLIILSLAVQAAMPLGPTISPTRNTTVVSTLPIIVANNTSSSVNITTITPVVTISPAITQEALKRGPMVYAATQSKVIVIDSSTRNVISTIKPDVDGAKVVGVAVSPDGQFVYMAYSWSVFHNDPYGGYYDKFNRVVRLNASTQQPINYYEFDNIYIEHLAVSPDGKVFAGTQSYDYHGYGGIKIMDFQQGKSWEIKYTFSAMMYDFAFSPDGNDIYYTGWYHPKGLYDLRWDENKVYYVELPGNYSNDYEYPRSVAVAKGGSMLYATIEDQQGIFAMNTEDRGKQIIPTDYYPLALAASSDGETLYAFGYFYDSNDKPIYLVHKYGALKTVGPFNNQLLDYMVTTKDSFYTYDSTDYITLPPHTRPGTVTITPDGKFAYISTIGGDAVTNVYGDGIVIYDLEYLNDVKTIAEKDSLFDIAAAQEKIMFSPPVDYSWLKQVAGFQMLNVSFPFVPTSFHPDNGTFAETYKEEFFVVYATFSDYIDNKTLNSSNYWLTEKSGAVVPTKVTAASKLAILSLDSQLKPDTDYVVHISKGVASKSGDKLSSDVEWSFTTRNTTNQSVIPISSVLNITVAKKITPLVQLNFTMPPENASDENPPPEAVQNQSGQQGGGTGQQPPPQQNVTNETKPPSMPSYNVTNETKPPSTPSTNVSNETKPPSGGGQPPYNVTNETKPPSNGGPPPYNVTNETRPPSNASGLTPAQPNVDIFTAIIDFFKSLFGLK